MYNFVDTVKVSGSAVLPSEALKLNGEYIENLIPGYRTLNVSGREALSPELSMHETGVRDGSTLKSKRYPARTIIVQYQLIAESSEHFRDAYNKLGKILNVEDAELIFADETDKFFIGTPSAVGEVKPGRNVVVGEIKFICTDPFKYSVKEYEVTATDVEELDNDGNAYTGKAFVFDYNGTYKAFPALEVGFYDESETDGENFTPLTGNGDCGFVAFFNEDGNIIQLGNPKELDGETYKRSETLVNQNFNNASSWGTASQKLWALNNAVGLYYSETQAGTVVLSSDGDKGYYLRAGNYGSGGERHGPTITRTIPADASGATGAKDFTFTYAHKFAPGVGIRGRTDVGVFYALAVSGSGSNRKVVAGVRVAKHSYGELDGKIDFLVNGKLVDSTDFQATINNKYFGIGNSVKTSTITKSGNKVTFNIAGIQKSFTCSDSGFADLVANEISFAFSKYAAYNHMNYNGLYSAKFVKHNCNAWREVPNKFNAGDVAVADCREGNIYVNNLLSPEYGAIGNDWEKFYLKPGANQIGIAYSDWITDEYVPALKLRYREVFL